MPVISLTNWFNVKIKPISKYHYNYLQLISLLLKSMVCISSVSEILDKRGQSQSFNQVVEAHIDHFPFKKETVSRNILTLHSFFHGLVRDPLLITYNYSFLIKWDCSILVHMEFNVLKFAVNACGSWTKGQIINSMILLNTSQRDLLTTESGVI